MATIANTSDSAALNAALDQEFVKNPDVTISQYVASVAKAVGDTIAVKGFDIFVLGE